jgi:hypothetical protein
MVHLFFLLLFLLLRAVGGGGNGFGEFFYLQQMPELEGCVRTRR